MSLSAQPQTSGEQPAQAKALDPAERDDAPLAWRSRLLAASIGAVWHVLGVFPGDSGPNVLAWIGRRGARLTGDRYHRGAERAVVGLGVDLPEAERIVAASVGNLARIALELRVFRRRLERGDDACWSVEGAEHLDQALEAGRGVLLCGGHFGAWELLPEMLARRFRPAWIVSHPRRNPKLEQRVARIRDVSIAGAIDKHDMRGLFRRLREGGVVCGLYDQRAGRSGWRIPFLDQPASHFRAPGVLARRCGVACVPMAIIRDFSGDRVHHRLVLEPPITADPSLPDDLAEVDVVRRLSASLARTVRAHPEQYLWTHDRWKHSRSAVTPPDEAGPRPTGPIPAGP